MKKVGMNAMPKLAQGIDIPDQGVGVFVSHMQSSASLRVPVGPNADWETQVEDEEENAPLKSIFNRFGILSGSVSP